MSTRTNGRMTGREAARLWDDLIAAGHPPEWIATELGVSVAVVARWRAGESKFPHRRTAADLRRLHARASRR